MKPAPKNGEKKKPSFTSDFKAQEKSFLTSSRNFKLFAAFDSERNKAKVHRKAVYLLSLRVSV